MKKFYEEPSAQLLRFISAQQLAVIYDSEEKGEKPGASIQDGDIDVDVEP